MFRNLTLQRLLLIAFGASVASFLALTAFLLLNNARATDRATQEIATTIAAIQTDSGGVAGAIGQITAIVGRINDIQTTIAAAVAEQSATTAEIARTVSDAARGTSEIAANISAVAEAAQQTSTGALPTRSAAGELTATAQGLRALVERASSQPRPAQRRSPEAPEAPVTRGGRQDRDRELVG